MATVGHVLNVLERVWDAMAAMIVGPVSVSAAVVGVVSALEQRVNKAG